MDVIALGGLLVVLALLVLAIVRWGVHPFLALTAASLAVGPVMGLSPSAAVEEYLTGFGGTLKWIGVVLVLGAIICELLEASGGVLRIADTVPGASFAPILLPLVLIAVGSFVGEERTSAWALRSTLVQASTRAGAPTSTTRRESSAVGGSSTFSWAAMLAPTRKARRSSGLEGVRWSSARTQ